MSCTAGFFSSAHCRTLWTARPAPIWYGFFISDSPFNAWKHYPEAIMPLGESRKSQRTTGQFPFVSLADDLIDRDPPTVEPQEDVADALKRVADLFQRVNETVSLANVDAMRQRSIGGGQPGGRAADSPRTDDRSMTPRDQPYYRPDQADIPAPVPAAKVPFHDTAVEMHGP